MHQATKSRAFNRFQWSCQAPAMMAKGANTNKNKITNAIQFGKPIQTSMIIATAIKAAKTLMRSRVRGLNLVSPILQWVIPSATPASTSCYCAPKCGSCKQN